jgi:hypothetical protein
MKQKEIELYRRDDGFWAGREKKDGSLSADAHKVSAEEIMTMFTEFFGDYCQETGQQKLLMQDAEGRLFVTMRLPDKKTEVSLKSEEKASKKAPKKTRLKKSVT